MKTKHVLLAVIMSLSMITSVFTQVPNYVPSTGLVGWWPFSGNANDLSGNINNGTLMNVILTTDRFGKTNEAYAFAGDSSYIEVPPIASLDNADSLTMSAWILPENTTGSRQFIIARGYDYATGSFFMCHESNQNDDKIRASFNGYPDFNLLSTKSYPIPYQTWQHLVITKSVNEVKMYIDGQLVDSKDYSLPLATSSEFVYFGTHKFASQNAGFWPYYFKGKIDDIGIWRRTLSPNEVADLFTGGICYQMVTVTDTLIINANITGYNPVEFASTIKIYPNPAKDHITIDNGDYTTLNGYKLRIVGSSC
jgi:hypothetical protein